MGTDVSQPRCASYSRGYTLPQEIHGELRRFQQTKVWISVLAMICDHATVVVAASFGVLAAKYLPLSIIVPVHVLLFCIAGRAMRGMEVMLHEGSHFNICRKPKWVNDLLTNALAAWPVFSSVGRYRSYHLKHHTKFGSHEDTDWLRYESLGLAELDRSRPVVFISGMARLMPRYLCDWYRSIGTDVRTFATSICWHMVFYVLPAWVVLGNPTSALLFWVTYIAIPLFVFLPPLRFLAESAEHTYAEETVFTASNTNCGRFHFFLHPHNDGYHAVHHLIASIPHHQLKRAHLWLTVGDGDGFVSRHRYRIFLFENPTTLAQRQQS